MLEKQLQLGHFRLQRAWNDRGQEDNEHEGGGGSRAEPGLARTQQTNELVVLVFKLLELLPRVLQLVLHLLDDFHIGIVQLGLTRLVWRGEGGGRG